jgi:hypothetical protein
MTPSERPQPPPDLPETPPPRPYPMTDYSFTLQAIMELQKGVGQLTARIDELVKKADGQGDKLNSISHQLYAAWALLIVFGIIGGFLVNHLWDPMTKLLVKALLEK